MWRTSRAVRFDLPPEDGTPQFAVSADSLRSARFADTVAGVTISILLELTPPERPGGPPNRVQVRDLKVALCGELFAQWFGSDENLRSAVREAQAAGEKPRAKARSSMMILRAAPQGARAQLGGARSPRTSQQNRQHTNSSGDGAALPTGRSGGGTLAAPQPGTMRSISARPAATGGRSADNTLPGGQSVATARHRPSLDGPRRGPDPPAPLRETAAPSHARVPSVRASTAVSAGQGTAVIMEGMREQRRAKECGPSGPGLMPTGGGLERGHAGAQQLPAMGGARAGVQGARPGRAAQPQQSRSSVRF